MYSIVIQLGAILCLPIYFRSRIARFLVHVSPRRTPGPHRAHASAHAGDDRVCLHGHSVAAADQGDRQTSGEPDRDGRFAAGRRHRYVDRGRSFWLTAYRGPSHDRARGRNVSLFQAIWIGICQVASAVFPGTSRSMSTIAAGQVAGMSRTAALEFSFFLSMPTMIAATGYDLLKTFHPKHGEAARPHAHRRPGMDGAPHWLCGLVHRGAGGGGMVHELGTPAGASRRSPFTGSLWGSRCWCG